MSIDDQRDLYQRLDGAVEAITPRPAPVDGVMRRGRVIRWRRRAVAVAGVAAVVAAGAVAVPSIRHAATENPATARYAVTVRPPGPHSPAGLIASGTINGKHWELTASRPGTGGVGHGRERVRVTGPAFGGAGAVAESAAFSPPDPAYPVMFSAYSMEPNQVQYGAVGANVSSIKVRLGNGTVLTLHPARVYGARVVAFAIPVGAPVLSATAYSPQGEIATAIPFNYPGGSATFGIWLRPGQHGLARASGLVGSGSYLGDTWSATAYVGPWGACLYEKTGGGGSAGTCTDIASAAELGTSVQGWTAGVPAVAGGSADRPVVRIAVTAPDGTTTQVHPVAVGGIKFFAFPFGKGPKHWKWAAYDGSGHVVASGEVIPV